MFLSVPTVYKYVCVLYIRVCVCYIYIYNLYYIFKEMYMQAQFRFAYKIYKHAPNAGYTLNDF